MKNGLRYLVTTSSYFYGPDGKPYRAAWGVLEVQESKQVFGFTPSRQHANWYVTIGKGDRAVTIAGCEVLYAVRLDDTPFIIEGEFTDKEGEAIPLNKIYLAQ